MIPISKIMLSNAEERAVLRVLRSGKLSQGTEVVKFEKEFAKYIGCDYAVAVANGTVALHAALLALGISKKDEVITTPFSFIASTNAILYVGAKPIFVDVGQDFNMDASKIEEKITSRTKAILPVHIFGNPCDMDKISQIAKKHKLFIIEDACQAHGAEYKGKKIGAFGNLACFSFYGTKNMTTGEGGMVTTNDPKLAEKLIMFRSHGSRVRYYHEFLGYNFRMTEMQAAIGRVQLKKLNSFNNKRIRNAHILNHLLKDVEGIITPQVNTFKKHVFHQYTIILTKKFPLSRANLLKHFKKNGIGFGIYYPLPINKQEEIVRMGLNNDDLPRSEWLSYNVLSLPVHPYVDKKDIRFIARTIKESLWTQKK